jgi:hypothetical protein
MDALMQSIQVNEKSMARIVYGEILYPYYDRNGIFEFDLLTGQGVDNYSVNLFHQPLTADLYSGEQVFIVSNPENGADLVDSIYIQVGSSVERIWKRGITK